MGAMSGEAPLHVKSDEAGSFQQLGSLFQGPQKWSSGESAGCCSINSPHMEIYKTRKPVLGVPIRRILETLGSKGPPFLRNFGM